MKKLLFIVVAIGTISAQVATLYDCGLQNKTIIFDEEVGCHYFYPEFIEFVVTGTTTAAFKTNYGIVSIYGDATESKTILRQQMIKQGEKYKKNEQFLAFDHIDLEGLTSYKVKMEFFDSKENQVGCSVFVFQKVVAELTKCGTDIQAIEFQNNITYYGPDSYMRLIYEFITGVGRIAQESEYHVIKVYGGAPGYQTLVKEEKYLIKDQIKENYYYGLIKSPISFGGLYNGIYNSIDSDYRIQFEVHNTKKQIIGCASFLAKTNYFGERE